MRAQDMFLFAHYLWTAPISIALSMYFLWSKLGPVSLAGLVYLVLVVPLNSILIGSRMRKYQVRAWVCGKVCVRWCVLVCVCPGALMCVLVRGCAGVRADA